MVVRSMGEELTTIEAVLKNETIYNTPIYLT